MNIIFYFTGTGNTLMAVRSIAEKIGNCDVAFMPDYHLRPVGYERIGFAFPVYSGEPPEFVKKFIRQLDLSECPDAYYFAVATFGGVPGNAFYITDDLLKEKGLRLNGCFGIRMNGNFISSYNPWEISEKQKAKINSGLEEAAERIKERTLTAIPNHKNIVFAFMHKHIMPYYLQSDKNFTVSDACVSCGVCYRVCPVANIIMSNGRPEFQGRCEQCMACINACPRKALNYKNVTQKRHRYINRDIQLQDLFHRS